MAHGARGALEQELRRERLAGAEVDEDVQSLETPSHRGGDAVEGREGARGNAEQMSRGRRDATDLLFERGISEHLNNVRKGFCTRAQLDALLAHLPAPLRPPIRVAYITGWRIKSEVLSR